MAEGMDKTEAVEAAVREMGDPKETGRALDRVHRPKTDWRLIVLVGLLSAGGFLPELCWKGICWEMLMAGLKNS